MIDAFMFKCLLHQNGTLFNTMCIFLPSPSIDEGQIKDLLQERLDIDGVVPPDILLFIATAGMKEILADLCSSVLISNAIPEFTRFSCPPPVRGILMNLDGSCSPATDNSTDFAKSGSVTQIRDQGLLSLFSANDIILRGNGQIHFEKPSGTHCDSFIRTGNAFISGAGTYFAALWLLRYITPQIKCIYTDTASINCLILSALLLRLQIDRVCRVPLVDSFGSYEGLDTYEFTEIRNSLFVISCSTSATLEGALKRKLRVSDGTIVTVVYLNADSTAVASNILCDISGSLDANVNEFLSFTKDKCPACKRHLPIAAIGGDQFLLDMPAPDSEVIKVEDAPKWLRTFVNDFVGTRVLCVHRLTRPGRHHPREIFIDVQKILKTYDQVLGDATLGVRYHQALRRRLAMYVPARLRHIIYIDDVSSKTLVDYILNGMTEEDKNKVSIIPHTEIPRDNIENSALAEGTLLVVSGIVATGQSMMEVNQLLRNRRDHSIVYLAGMTRTHDRKRLEDIVNNVQFGREGGRHYTFNSVYDIFLPDHRMDRPSPWDLETETWMNIRESLPDGQDGDAIRAWCEDRIGYLEAGKVNGMTDALFLPDIYGGTLHLRQGFVFWPEKQYGEDGSYSQADVYFTVSAVLHNWRKVHGVSARSVSKRRVLVAPRMFFRFSDGCIQAALLRAAELGELDYRADQSLSDAMAKVLSFVFEHYRDPQGEATLEFLLALREHRVAIENHTLLAILGAFEEQIREATDVYSALVREMVRTLLDRL